ncbi:MAG: peptide deformylase [Peptococcaceae bacterium]|nr:peptide deformylase [Peptococcaceae bacterium]
MAVFRIVNVGESVLREKAKPVSNITPNILKLLDNLADTLQDAKGLGLAAPQIGVSKRVAIVQMDSDELFELINPVILQSHGECLGMEGCLSMPGVQGEVVRSKFVRVRALDRTGAERVYEVEGLLARAFQHEIDHLEGVLFADKASRLEKTD